MSAALLVLPQLLFRTLPAGIPRHAILVEEQLLFSQYRFHKRKLAFHRASLRAYGDSLREMGWTVRYVNANEAGADVRALPALLAAEGIRTLHLFDPCDDWISQRLQGAAAAVGLALVLHESPQFLLSAAQLGRSFDARRKRYRHQQFYETQRRHFGLLLDNKGEPLGGRWSFDTDNRRSFPRRAKAPPWPAALDADYRDEARRYVDENFPANPGASSGTLDWPVTHAGAEAWLNDFLQQRFTGFGSYEDAIVLHEPVLHHSLLSPLMNAGLLLPAEVCTRALAHAREHQVPLNDVEGFLRQILGWREFVRGLYLHHGRQQRTANHWGFTRALPAAFYTGTSGIAPVDAVIHRVLAHGYCHHIERLMVLGCFMLLCECHPDGVYRWFMELFVDAYDWVMVPNVYGMSQFADGGLMATKPYICASNYILKMSDFPKGEWCEIWDALFWRFLHVHSAKLAGNPRLNMLLGSFSRRSPSARESLLQRAETYLAALHAGGSDYPGSALT